MGAAGTSRGRHPRRFLASAVLKVAGIAVVLGLWQLLSATGVLAHDSFPSMTAVFRAVVDELTSARGWRTIGNTLAGWGIGFAIGAAAAIAVGMALGLNRVAFRSTILVIAILPLLMLEFGGTLKMEYVVVAFGVFWPLVIQVVYGVRSMDPVVRDTAEVLRVTGWRRFSSIVLPSAAPFIATGLRIAAAVALIVAIIAELIGGAPGLGRDILVAEDSGTSALPLVYALIVITGATGMAIAAVFTLLERRLLRWHERFRPVQGAFA
jgi:ABC-type nitrate/sulfonate/bicarbonate transport system permease component